MTVRLYMNRSLLERPGNATSYNGYALRYPEGGQPYIELSGDLPEFRMPAEIAGELDYISYITKFYAGGSEKMRVTGEYSFRSARVVLNWTKDDSGMSLHFMQLTSKNLDDGIALYRQIRTGAIYPELSYENVQVPPPARHLKQLWREFWALVHRDLSQRLFAWRHKT